MVTAEIHIMNSGTFYLFIKDITHHARNQHFNTVHYLLQINKKPASSTKAYRRKAYINYTNKNLKNQGWESELYHLK